MDKSRQTKLVLGGTGRTGSLVARKLAQRGLSARIIAGAVGRPVRHNDIERSVWIDAAIAAGVAPPSYGVMLNWLTSMIASGHGSRPNDDVRRVTGFPPASFADFAHRNARAWAVPAALS
jgi:ribosomal protein S28E/S33